MIYELKIFILCQRTNPDKFHISLLIYICIYNIFILVYIFILYVILIHIVI